MKKIFLFVLLALTACKKEVKEEPHIFRTYEASMKRKSDSLPPLPPRSSESYYANHNIIIDSADNLYYFKYDKSHVWICDATGINADSIYPAMFINLSPEKFKKIPNSKLNEFLKTNFPVTNEERLFLSVGSSRDSFQSPKLQKISDYLDKKLKHSIFVIRHTTQEEEEVVLDYKKRKIPYDYHKIKWDSTRTTFRNYPL